MAEKSSSNVFKWIAIGCLIPTVLIVIGFVVITIFGLRFFKGFADPGEAEKTARSIMDYQFPQGSKGLFQIKMMGMKMAGIQSDKEPPEAFLMLASFPESMSGNSEQQFERTMEENFRGAHFKVHSSRKIKGTLCGKKVSITVEKGENRRTGRGTPMTSYQSQVAYRNTIRLVMAMATGRQGDRIARSIFDSLRCK